MYESEGSATNHGKVARDLYNSSLLDANNRLWFITFRRSAARARLTGDGAESRPIVAASADVRVGLRPGDGPAVKVS